MQSAPNPSPRSAQVPPPPHAETEILQQRIYKVEYFDSTNVYEVCATQTPGQIIQRYQKRIQKLLGAQH